jgi:tetratricopeptide (TPR) repeat protein
MFWPQQQADSSLVFATKQIYENPNKAIEVALEVLNSTEATTDVKVRSLIIISTAYSSKREYEKSLEYSLKALDMFPNIENIQLKVNLLNRIGGQYQELNVYDKAINYLDQAYKLIETLPESASNASSKGFNNLVRGFIYREQMSCDIALNYFDSAIEAYNKVKSQSLINANLSTAYYNRGNCLLSMNRPNEAELSFLQSITYAKKNNAKSLIAFAQKGLASVYTAEGNNPKAITLLTDALDNSEEVGDKVLNRAIYQALASNYLAIGDLKNFSIYQNKNVSINKEIIQTERKTIDNSILNLMDENSKKVEEFQNRIVLFWIILLLLIIGISVLIILLIYKSENTLKHLKTELKL